VQGSISPEPFVGRQYELRQLRAALDRASDGRGQLLLVAGEPGIGKTRLLTEFAKHARAEGWQVLSGRAYDSEGAPPYLPFREALRDYARAAPLKVLRALLDEAGPVNTLNAQLTEELDRVLAEIEADPKVRAVVRVTTAFHSLVVQRPDSDNGLLRGMLDIEMTGIHSSRPCWREGRSTG